MIEMKSYIGVKQVNARPMTRGEYNVYRGWTIPADENPDDAGYLTDNGAIEQWVPTNIFESEFFELVVNDPDANIMAERFMGEVRFDRFVRPGVVDGVVTTRSGWEALRAEPDTEEREATEECIKKQLFQDVRHCLKFVQAWAKNGIHGG